MQYLPVFALFAASVVLVLAFTHAVNQLAAPATPNGPLLEVGGFKFSVHEALMGALTSIIFVLCAAFYARFIAEVNQMRTAQILGAWQFGYSPELGSNNAKIVAWLMSGSSDPYSFAADYRTELAVSLADRHMVTRKALLGMDAVIRYGIWAAAGFAIVQSLLNSRHLRGLRILLPAMIITIVGFIFIFFPETRDLVHLLDTAQPLAR